MRIFGQSQALVLIVLFAALLNGFATAQEKDSLSLKAVPVERSLKSGHAVEIDVTLSNRATKPFYIPKEIGIVAGPGAWVEFRLRDNAGRRKATGLMIAEPKINPLRNPVESIKSEWFVLNPEYSYARRVTIPNFPDSPGKYRLQVIVHFPSFSGEETEALKNLQYPVWTTPISADASTIIVLGK